MCCKTVDPACTDKVSRKAVITGATTIILGGKSIVHTGQSRDPTRFPFFFVRAQDRIRVCQFGVDRRPGELSNGENLSVPSIEILVKLLPRAVSICFAGKRLAPFNIFQANLPCRAVMSRMAKGPPRRSQCSCLVSPLDLPLPSKLTVR